MNAFKLLNLVMLQASAALILSACGGGGGSDSPPASAIENEAAISYGTFSALPVTGLYYETETLSGLTDGQGRFRFLPGENISFRLGNTQLGGAEAKAVISPAELSGFEVISDETTLTQLLGSPMINSLDLVLNINAVLMSLDQDGKPENGIQLGAAHQRLEKLGTELDLAMKAQHFAASAEFKALVNSQVGQEPKDLEFVATHLYAALGQQLSVKRLTRARTATNEDSASISKSVYNPLGELASETIALGDDSNLVEIQYQYDSENRLSAVSNSYTGDRETLTYTQGKLAVVRVVSASNEQIYQETHQYDKQGNLKRLAFDQNGDGQEDLISLFDTTPQREQITVLKKQNGQTLQSSKITEYRGDRVESVSEDYDNDGQDELQMLYSYDAQGRQTSRRIVSQDPAIESNISYFEYDDQDRLIRYTVDQDENGQIDYIEVYAYDYNDNRTLFRRDFEADGVWNYSAFYRYDQQGNRIEVKEDTDGNGLIDQTWQAELQQETVSSDWSTVFAAF